MPTTHGGWRLAVTRPSLALALGLAWAVTGTAQAEPPTPAAPQRTTASQPQGATAWSVLTPGQRTALSPLQGIWGALEPERQSKWLELARRFPRLSADEQQRVQRRMDRWAHMTAEERGRARLQFQQTRTLGAEQRRAAWEAYQALSPQERQALANPAAGRLRPVGPTLVQAGPGVSTVSVTRLTPLRQGDPAQAPREQGRAVPVDRNTLLPRHAAATLGRAD